MSVRIDGLGIAIVTPDGWHDSDAPAVVGTIFVDESLT